MRPYWLGSIICRVRGYHKMITSIITHPTVPEFEVDHCITCDMVPSRCVELAATRMEMLQNDAGKECARELRAL
jgi:hypothetical protein